MRSRWWNGGGGEGRAIPDRLVGFLFGVEEREGGSSDPADGGCCEGDVNALHVAGSGTGRRRLGERIPCTGTSSAGELY